MTDEYATGPHNFADTLSDQRRGSAFFNRRRRSLRSYPGKNDLADCHYRIKSAHLISMRTMSG